MTRNGAMELWNSGVVEWNGVIEKCVKGRDAYYKKVFDVDLILSTIVLEMRTTNHYG